MFILAYKGVLVDTKSHKRERTDTIMTRPDTLKFKINVKVAVKANYDQKTD